MSAARQLLASVLPSTSRSRGSTDNADSSDDESWSAGFEEFVEKTKSFHSSHQKFFIRLSLACSVAFWVTIFSIPLYFGKIHYAVFGFRGGLHETYSALGKDLTCSNTMVGRMRNIGNFTHPNMVRWTPDMSPFHDNLRHRDIWCGYLPSLWEDYWPNIAQFIVFTVYSSTGDTVRLAWQGLVGTACACLNLEFMCLLYPGGAYGAACESEGCTPQPYNAVVCWIDVFFVLFLFLFSRANENTIKFGMSWHVSFMMDFMNPNKKMAGGMLEDMSGLNMWSNDLVADILLTSIFGAAISILATMIPRICLCMTPLANRVWTAQNSLAVAEQIGAVWQESIDYLCGTKSYAKKYQLQRKIDDVRDKLSDTKGQVEQAWWETFQCGAPEQVRLRLHIFLSGAQGVQRTMYALANCILYEDFSGQHNEFVGTLNKCIRQLHADACQLTITCAKAAADGIISEEEEEDIDTLAKGVRSSQQDLLHQFRQAVPSGISASLAEEITFLFALSYWASTTEDLAQALKGDEPRKSWVGVVRQGFSDTWGVHRILEKDHLKFVVRNLIPISVCYILGYFAPSSSVFVKYSATMSNTLALLITRFSGSAFQKNIHRTLGVLLGKFWPILLKASWSHFPCQSTERGILQLTSLFLFVALSSYVYYSSKMWSTIAVLVAGYGVYPLMIPCDDDASEDSLYAARYKEIGQVTVAIMLQFCIESALHATSPGELAIKKMEEGVELMVDGFKGFFEGDLQRMSRALATDEHLKAARALAAEADPTVMLAPGWAAPFKHRLYIMSLDVLEQIQSDFNMLWNACLDQRSFAESGEHASAILEPLANNPSMRDLYERLTGHAADMMNALFRTLRHTSETPLDGDILQEVVSVSWKAVLPEHERERLYRSLTHNLPVMSADMASSLVNDPQARATVAIRALENAIHHLEDISSLIIGEDIF